MDADQLMWEEGQALKLVDSRHFAGTAERVAMEAEDTIQQARMCVARRDFNGRNAAVDMLRRLERTNSTWLPMELWLGLSRAASMISAWN